MPERPPRTSLGREIVLSLALKVAALAAMGLLLFGPGDRVHPDSAMMAARLAGHGP